MKKMNKGIVIWIWTSIWSLIVLAFTLRYIDMYGFWIYIIITLPILFIGQFTINIIINKIRKD